MVYLILIALWVLSLYLFKRHRDFNYISRVDHFKILDAEIDIQVDNYMKMCDLSIKLKKELDALKNESKEDRSQAGEAGIPAQTGSNPQG